MHKTKICAAGILAVITFSIVVVFLNTQDTIVNEVFLNTQDTIVNEVFLNTQDTIVNEYTIKVNENNKYSYESLEFNVEKDHIIIYFKLKGEYNMVAPLLYCDSGMNNIKTEVVDPKGITRLSVVLSEGKSDYQFWDCKKGTWKINTYAARDMYMMSGKADITIIQDNQQYPPKFAEDVISYKASYHISSYTCSNTMSFSCRPFHIDSNNISIKWDMGNNITIWSKPYKIEHYRYPDDGQYIVNTTIFVDNEICYYFLTKITAPYSSDKVRVSWEPFEKDIIWCDVYNYEYYSP